MNRGKELQLDETLIAPWQHPNFINALNKLLKSHGVKIKTRTNYSKWGDLVAIKVEKIP